MSTPHNLGTRRFHLPMTGTVSALILLLTLFLLHASAFGAEGIERLFDEANVLYRQGHFEAAAAKYAQIEELGVANAALYYNLGNCNYRLGQIGQSILYYERALRLSPSDEDVIANLEIANQATVDKLKAPEAFALARWLRSALYSVSPSFLGRAAGVLWVAFCILVAIQLGLRRDRISPILKYGSLIAAALLVLTVSWFGIQSWDRNDRVEAVIQVKETEVKSSPDMNSVEVFLIHEGTKVRITQTSGDWLEIVLIDGKVGWVQASALDII